MNFDNLKIVLSYVYPPIPDRRHDWLAYVDGEEETTWLQGHGRTPTEAIADLNDVLEGVWEDREPVDNDRLKDYPDSFADRLTAQLGHTKGT